MQKKVMKVSEYKDGASSWRIACDCGDRDHDAELWFENEDDWPYTNMHLTMHVGFYPYYGSGLKNWFLDKGRRISHAAKVLWTGYAQLQGDVILDEEGIKAMQLALTNAMKHAKSTAAKIEAERQAKLTGKAVSGKDGKTIRVGS